jgi:hypothetical protein
LNRATLCTGLQKELDDLDERVDVLENATVDLSAYRKADDQDIIDTNLKNDIDAVEYRVKELEDDKLDKTEADILYATAAQGVKADSAENNAKAYTDTRLTDYLTETEIDDLLVPVFALTGLSRVLATY